MNDLVHGFNIVGICKGIMQKQNGKYLNNDLVIGVQVPDGFGGFTESQIYVGLFGDHLSRIQAQMPNAQGKAVSVSVLIKALKSERTGNAYQKIQPHQNTNLLVLSGENQLKKVG